jgi:hypothetical protein
VCIWTRDSGGIFWGDVEELRGRVSGAFDPPDAHRTHYRIRVCLLHMEPWKKWKGVAALANSAALVMRMAGIYNPEGARHLCRGRTDLLVMTF